MEMESFYLEVRNHSVSLCAGLLPEDYNLQPADFVSPAKWHLAHTTWFWENFVLEPYLKDYRAFNPSFHYFFNSYYESLGDRNPRPSRGLITRPTVDEVLAYRAYTDSHMLAFLSSMEAGKYRELVMTGLQHEQQHQELLLTDIKYSLSFNRMYPAIGNFAENKISRTGNRESRKWVKIPEGMHTIGANAFGTGTGQFSFDNEQPEHRVFLRDFSISSNLVTNREYLEFMQTGGYSNFKYWHSEGWAWVQENRLSMPLYWLHENGRWMTYTLGGLVELELDAPVSHLSLYESFAFAEWAGLRLPTEFEWEAACSFFAWGERWEWTLSSYLPYPGYRHAEGALGEYNGKFMIGQMVLRGASLATPENHSRPTYRNFFHPAARWQFSGLRLCKNHD